MKQTLLEIVQDILSDADSDLVSTIGETPESEQVAQIVKRTFIDLVSTRDWPHLKTLDQCASGTVAQPTHCALPSDTKELHEVRYNISTDVDKVSYKVITYMYPDEFLDLINKRDTSKDNVQSVLDSSGVVLSIINDTAPTYWTSFNDTEIVFDSYDNSTDTTIQNSKSSLLLEKSPTWVNEDDAVPDLPTEAFSLLIAEAKSRAFLALSQEPNEKAEQQAYRSRVWLSRKAWGANGGVRYKTYGRSSKK